MAIPTNQCIIVSGAALYMVCVLQVIIVSQFHLPPVAQLNDLLSKHAHIGEPMRIHHHVSHVTDKQASSSIKTNRKTLKHKHKKDQLRPQIYQDKLSFMNTYKEVQRLEINPKPSQFPPLSDLTSRRHITAPVDWLLDFAIMGFPKCGTWSLLKYFANLPQTKVLLPYERCNLCNGKEVELVQSLHDLDTHNATVLRGLKCPKDMESVVSLPRYKTLFPKTKIFVGLRHPVLWFESFYNFRVNANVDIMDIRQLVGNVCSKKRAQSICTHRSRFHIFLARLGKTPMHGDEKELLGEPVLNFGLPNKVFLYEIQQLDDSSGDRATQFRTDMAAFLGINDALPPMIHEKPGTEDYQSYDAKTRRKVDEKKVDICKDEYIPLREVLMDNARRSSRWLRRYFLQSEDVFVSSPEYFYQLLEEWEHDPCDYRRKSAT